MENVRHHFITLCTRNNTEVTHIVKNGKIEVTYEEAVNGGFKTLVTDIQGNVLSNDGFNSSEVAYFSNFTRQCARGIEQESRGEL